jgi:hypothetical protein
VPALYVDEFIRELRRDGEATFRSRHAAPVIVVTRAAGELKEGASVETTVMAETSGWRIEQVSLLNRVFAVSRGAFEKDSPMVLGRNDIADIVIPDHSISKRHCLFEAKPEGTTVMDCGSTNGTTVGETEIPANQPVLLRGGERLSVGNFSFLFHTPDSFVAYLKHVVKI